MGVMTHYVEISIEREKFKVSCACGWRKDCLRKHEAQGSAHLHLAEVYMASDV